MGRVIIVTLLWREVMINGYKVCYLLHWSWHHYSSHQQISTVDFSPTGEETELKMSLAS